jgi:hypothetical protein
MEVRSRSNKTAAIVTGTLVLEYAESGGDAIAFEQAIDTLPTIRRLGAATVQQGTTRRKLLCDVEYGPVFGGHKSDLHRQLAVIAERLGTQAYAVYGFARHELRTPESITEKLMALTARMQDPDMPVAACADLSEKIARLRRCLDALPAAPASAPSASTQTIDPPSPLTSALTIDPPSPPPPANDDGSVQL